MPETEINGFSKDSKHFYDMDMYILKWSSNTQEDSECSCSAGCLACVKKWSKSNLLALLVIGGVILGIALGFGLRNVWSYRELRNMYYLELPGRLLYNLMDLFVIPLVMTSLVRAMTDLGKAATNSIGLATLLYFVVSTYFAAILGAVLAFSFNFQDLDHKVEVRNVRQSVLINGLDALTDFLRQCLPNNIVTACFERMITEYVPTTVFEVDKNITTSVTVEKPVLVKMEGANIFGLSVISITGGILLSRLGEKGEPLKQLNDSINDVVTMAIRSAIWYMPIGLVFLVAGKLIGSNVDKIWNDLALYVAIVHLGLMIHGVYVLPTLLYLLTGKNPLLYGARQLKALVVAWGTASSYATLPVTMDCLVRKNNVNRSIVNIVAPVGATINMNGTALTQAVAAIFVSQISGSQIGFIELVILRDRTRTLVNVWGDAICAGLMDYYYGEDFDEDGRPWALSRASSRSGKGEMANGPRVKIQETDVRTT